MDSAEEVFAERGYYGSSLREVSARCGAAIGLIAHHFPTKEILFKAVVERKLGLLRALIGESIAQSVARDATDGRGLIRAFIAPFLEASAQKGHVIRNYIRLTSHFMSTYTVPELRSSLEDLQPISALFTDQLRQMVPGLPEHDFMVAAYLIEAALIFMVQDSGFLESLAGDALGLDRMNDLIDPAATFFAGGIDALVARS